MIRIDAIIKPERVNLVLEAMSEAGCTGFTYSNVTGKGNQDGVEVFTGRGSSTQNRSSVPKVLVKSAIFLLSFIPSSEVIKPINFSNLPSLSFATTSISFI